MFDQTKTLQSSQFPRNKCLAYLISTIPYPVALQASRLAPVEAPRALRPAQAGGSCDALVTLELELAVGVEVVKVGVEVELAQI